MNFLLGKIPQEHLEDCDATFQGSDGSHFYYRVRFDEDGVLIEDTIGRFVPIDVDHFHLFAKMFNNLVDYTEAQEQMEKDLLAILTDGATVC